MIRWCRGHMVPWSYAAMVICCHGQKKKNINDNKKKNKNDTTHQSKYNILININIKFILFNRIDLNQLSFVVC